MNAIPAALGIYGVQDAARLAGVPPRRIRGWLAGYGQRAGKIHAAPVLRRQHELCEGELALGFLDLLGVAFLGVIVRAAERQGRAPRWRAIRTAADAARRILGTDHPFAVRRIHTDGRTVFHEAQQTKGDPALYDLVANNYAIYDVLAESFLASVDLEGDAARRWRPEPTLGRIVVGPRRAFGRSVEDKSGAPAEALFDAWRAEGGNASRVAAYCGTDVAGVDQAVRFHLGVYARLPIAA